MIQSRGEQPATAASPSPRVNTPKMRYSTCTSTRSPRCCAAADPAPSGSRPATPAMPQTPFIITIDTEGDGLWARPREVTTRNAQYVPRFQSLCERYGFKAVYLTTWEMAGSDAFVEFGRDVLARGTGEIGMHLHA